MSDDTNIEFPEVFAKCKRGSDPVSMGQNCESKMAQKLSQDGSSAVTFRCTKCKYTWTVAVGGSFNIC